MPKMQKEESPMINIEGLNKADVLAVLYNTSRPIGMGFIQAGTITPLDMTREQAQNELDSRGIMRDRQLPLDFEYVYGRPLKVNLSSDIEFEGRYFDANNSGHGTAAEAIAHLYATGDIHCADGSSFAMEEMSEEDSHLFLLGALNKA
jgi:hypothetical protein